MLARLQTGMKRALDLNDGAVMVTAAVAAVYCHGVADAVWRGPYLVPAVQHYLASGVLYTAIGGLTGALLSLISEYLIPHRRL